MTRTTCANDPCDERRRARRRRALAVGAGLLLAALAAAGCKPEPAPPAPRDRPQHLPKATIRVGDVPLVVEVADDEAERRAGMMFRERLGPDEAMLFVFGRDENLAFWMKNTWVDLDLAYLRADGTIVQIERLTALVTDPVHSREPVRYALETPAGWLARHGIGVGTTVILPSEAASPPPP